MSVYKVLELIGSSTVSWQDAVEEAVREAGKTIDHIVAVEVIKSTGKVENGRIVEYSANVRISFLGDK